MLVTATNLYNTKIMRRNDQRVSFDVKLKFAQVVCLNNREELNPSLELVKSNCKRLSSSRCPPITMEVVDSTPPSTNARQETSLLTWTIAFAPKTLQNTSSLFCSTKSIGGTAGPTLVTPNSSESKHSLKGLLALLWKHVQVLLQMH